MITYIKVTIPGTSATLREVDYMALGCPCAACIGGGTGGSGGTSWRCGDLRTSLLS